MIRPSAAGALTVGLALAALSCGCAGTGGAPGTALSIRFVDPAWTTGAVPLTGRCRECGGGGFSPALTVAGVPVEARSLEVTFLDLTAQGLNWPSHHGALGVVTDGATTVMVPSVRERTTSLPPGVVIARNHGSGHTPTIGYIAPCACDGNNLYVVRVTARSGDRVLAKGETSLGHCCAGGH